MADQQASGPLSGPSSEGAGEPSHGNRPERPRPAAPWPSVTVVVATRDRPALLERAVRGILDQTYAGDIECVVVFDQSTPAAVPVDVPAGRQLRLVANTRTPGLAGARNTGITSSDGALIAFCDDDDDWDADKLRLQATRLECSTASFVACGVRIHHSGHVMARLPPHSVSLSQLVRERVTALHPSTFLVRRDAVHDIGLVDEEIPGSYGEDYDWLLRAARLGPIVSVQQPLVNVYWHEQSFFAERWQAIADALPYLLRKHPELIADPHGLARIVGQIAFAQAALARRSAACQASWRALRNNPLERRAYLALAVASGIVSAKSVVRQANRRGRGI